MLILVNIGLSADEGLIGLAAIAAREGQPERAARLLGAARALGYPPIGDQPIDDRLERATSLPRALRTASQDGRTRSSSAPHCPTTKQSPTRSNRPLNGRPNKWALRTIVWP
jgi:hypothetical protein